MWSKFGAIQPRRVKGFFAPSCKTPILRYTPLGSGFYRMPQPIGANKYRIVVFYRKPGKTGKLQKV